MHWSDTYVGRQYISGEFDCADLAAAVRREVFAQDIQLPTERRPGPFGRNAQIADLQADYADCTEQPADGDAVLLNVRGRLQHIGVYCLIDGEPWVLHNAMDARQVVRQRLRDLTMYGYRVGGYYKWK